MSDLVSGLGARPPHGDRPIGSILAHLRFISQLPLALLLEWISGPSERVVEGGKWALLKSKLSRGRSIAEVARSAVAHARPRGTGGTLTEHLSSAYTELCLAASLHRIRGDPLLDIGDPKIFLLDPTRAPEGEWPSFVRPSQCFWDVTAPPYAYMVDNALHRSVRSARGLNDMFKFAREPALRQLQAWLEDLKAKSSPLSQSSLTMAVRFVNLAHKQIKVEQQAGRMVALDRPLLVPDRHHTLQPVSKLHVHDANWLSGRVDVERRVPLACEDVPNHVLVDLGAVPLSRCVTEEPAGSIERMQAPYDEIVDQLSLWNTNLRSKMIRLMLRRAVTSPGVLEEDVRQAALDKVARLASGEVVPVEEIRSKFILTSGNGEKTDVTLEPHGSKALLVDDGVAGPTVYVRFEAAQEVSPLQPQRQRSGTARRKRVANQLKQTQIPIITQLKLYFGDSTTAAICFHLLDVENPEAMKTVLKDLHIPTSDLEMWVGSVYSEGLSLRPILPDELEAHLEQKVPAVGLPRWQVLY